MSVLQYLCLFVVVGAIKASATAVPTSFSKTSSQRFPSAELIAVGGTQTNRQFAGTNDVDIVQISQNNYHTPAAVLPSGGLESFGGALYNNIVYVVGGRTTTKDYSRKFMAYDVGADKWSFLRDFPYKVYGNTVAVVNGEVHSFGGIAAEYGYMNYTYKYDMNKHLWWRLPNPLPRDDLIEGSCVVVDNLSNQIYLLHKWGYLYRSDDSAQTWVQLSSIDNEQTAPSCAFLQPANVILVAGGARNNESINDVQMYDISKNEWIALGQMTKPRMSAQAAAIPNTNDAIVCGGYDTSMVQVYSDCEMFGWKDKQWGFTNFALNKPRMNYGLFVSQPESRNRA